MRTVSAWVASFVASPCSRWRQMRRRWPSFISCVSCKRWGVQLVDCQVYTEHLERFGAVEWPRRAFLHALHELRDHEGGPGMEPWTFDPDFDPLDPNDDDPDEV